MNEKVIWKYDVPLVGRMSIPMPLGAEIVHAHCMRAGSVSFWAVVDPKVIKELRHFYVVGTGEEWSWADQYRATAISGVYVWHLIERPH